MTTPTGSPAWVRSVDISSYGGSSTKSDYLGIGVVNPRTDISAAQYLRLTADIAAVARTSPFVTISFLCRDTPSADDPLVLSVLGMRWSYSSTSGYDGGAPPTGYPTVTRIGDGHIRITFASTYTDDYGVSGAFSPKMAAACGQEVYAVTGNAKVYSATAVDAYLFDASTGSATTNATGICKIW